MRRYRFGFVLSTGGGNRTRFENLRVHAERDASVECVWAPNPGFVQGDRWAWLPDTLARRRVSLACAAPVLRQLGQLDAVMFHALDPYVLASLRSLAARKPALVGARTIRPARIPTSGNTTAW